MVKSKVENLESLLKGSLGEGVQVLDQKTDMLTAPGEHYGSVMLKLDITIKNNKGRTETLNLVAKLLPTNEMLRLAFDIYVTFKKEVIAYTEAIPALVNLQLEYNVPPSKIIDIFPKCYGARVSLDKNSNEVDDDGVLLFENLKLQGYKTEDRLVGFDLDAARIIIRDLAKFHSLPIALRLLKPKVFEEKVMPCLVKNKGLEQLPPEVGIAFHETIMEKAKEIPELKVHLDRLQEVVDDAAANPIVNIPQPDGPWSTMCHWDYWVSNTMLLKDENGKALKNKMIDLQLMRYASAPRDLVFFMFTSLINSILDEHFDELIKLYHDSFIDNLNDYNLNLDQYSWDKFREELNRIGKIEIYHVLIMLKPICTERGMVKNSVEDFKDTDWSRKDLLGPNHKRKLRDTVLAFHKRNWLY